MMKDRYKCSISNSNKLGKVIIVECPDKDLLIATREACLLSPIVRESACVGMGGALFAARPLP